MKTALVVLRLPWVRVDLSPTPAGLLIRRKLGGRTWGLPTGRLGRAVLALPSSEAAYVKGRRRQALRTNAGHARDAGVSCSAVGSLAGRVGAAQAVFAERCDGPDALAWLEATLGPAQAFVALAADGSPITFASAIIDGETAYLNMFISSEHHAEGGWARYLLQVHLAVELGHVGVRYLLSDSALLAPGGVSHFQHLVGFDPTNVKVRTRR